MLQQKKTKIKNEIINLIISVIRVIWLANSYSKEKKLKKLASKDFYKGIKIIKDIKGFLIKIYILSFLNIRTKIAAKEIYAAINSYFEVKNIDIVDIYINVYVKGVQ